MLTLIFVGAVPQAPLPGFPMVFLGMDTLTFPSYSSPLNLITYSLMSAITQKTVVDHSEKMINNKIIISCVDFSVSIAFSLLRYATTMWILLIVFTLKF